MINPTLLIRISSFELHSNFELRALNLLRQLLFAFSAVGASLAASQPLFAAAPADQAAIAKAFEKIYAEVTFDRQGNITGVDFTDSDFSDKELVLLRDLPKLEAVVIVGSQFTDRSVPLVCGLKTVKQLTLENTELSSAGVLELRDLPAVTTLSLRRNSRLSDEGLAKLSERFPKLEQLLLLFNNFTDAAMDHVAPLTGLRVLDLRGCMKIGDAGVSKLAPLVNLERLKIRSPEVTDAAMETIRRFPKPPPPSDRGGDRL
jgi:hypothetical protein